MQLGSWFLGTEKLELAGQIPATVVAGGEGKPAREDQGTRGNLARGDVQVGVDRSRWNGDDPRRWLWSSTMAAVFRHAGDWRGVGVIMRTSPLTIHPHLHQYLLRQHLLVLLLALMLVGLPIK
jgi:hypothetical protein